MWWVTVAVLRRRRLSLVPRDLLSRLPATTLLPAVRIAGPFRNLRPVLEPSGRVGGVDTQNPASAAMKNLGIAGAGQWLTDLSRGFLSRGHIIIPGASRAASSAASAALITAGALSLGAAGSLAWSHGVDKLAAFAGELREVTASLQSGPGNSGGSEAALLPLPSDWPADGVPKVDETSSDPFSLSPLEAGEGELDLGLLGSEGGEVSAACVAVTLEGHIMEGGHLLEPKTRTRFPLLLREAPQAPGQDQGSRGPQGAPNAPLAAPPFAGPVEGLQEAAGVVGQVTSAPGGSKGKGKRRRLLPWGRKEVVEERFDARAAAPVGPTQASGTALGDVLAAGERGEAGTNGGPDWRLDEERDATGGAGPTFGKAADCQVLTGVGVRSKVIAKVKSIKVYAFGLYVHPGQLKEALGHKYKDFPAQELKTLDEFYSDLLSREVGMTVRLVVFYRGLKMEMVRKALDKSLSNRLKKLTGHADDAGLRLFNEYLSQPIDISRGTTIDFTWQPGGKLLTNIDGRKMGPIESPNLCRAFFDLYIGDPPVCAEAKDKIGESIGRILSEC